MRKPNSNKSESASHADRQFARQHLCERRQSRFIAANLAAARYHGRRVAERSAGKNGRRFLSGGTGGRVCADEVELMQSGQPLINKEECHKDAAGKWRTILTTKIPLKIPAENPAGSSESAATSPIADWRSWSSSLYSWGGPDSLSIGVPQAQGLSGRMSSLLRLRRGPIQAIGATAGVPGVGHGWCWMASDACQPVEKVHVGVAVVLPPGTILP